MVCEQAFNSRKDTLQKNLDKLAQDAKNESLNNFHEIMAYSRPSSKILFTFSEFMLLIYDRNYDFWHLLYDNRDNF